MVHRRLLPRLINWKSAPNKRLGMTEMKRHNLVKKLLHTLILEERIKTTSAKAKFIQFYADRLLELAKSGTEEAYQQACQLVDKPSVVLPKLFGRMAARYQNHQDKPTRILLNGFRDYKKPGQGPMAYPDAASMAILEFSDSPKSVSFQMAKYSIGKVKERLAEIEDQLYFKETVQLIHPVTKESLETVRLVEKDMSKFDKIQLKKKERFVRNLLAYYEYRVERTSSCFKEEIEYLREQLPQVQEKLNSLMETLKSEESDRTNISLPEEFVLGLRENGFDIQDGEVKIQDSIIELENDIEQAEAAAKKRIILTKKKEEDDRHLLDDITSTTTTSTSQQTSQDKSGYFSSFLGKLKNLGGNRSKEETR